MDSDPTFWGNTIIESFFSIIKREELKWHSLNSKQQAHQVIIRYIYGYYLPIRSHTTLGSLSPYAYQKNQCPIAVYKLFILGSTFLD
ncbi:IS3 family transposase [Carnobacterium maltaromaticum]|uniref:IS3 family transposase n=1 Tax=Carnobacterium maltaromaticum TaxID=2751 RepID=UPI0039C9BC71